MTDLERMKNLFDKIGLQYKIITSIDVNKTDTHTTGHGMTSVLWDMYLEIDEGAGYAYFYTLFYFLKGKFQGHGVWE